MIHALDLHLSGCFSSEVDEPAELLPGVLPQVNVKQIHGAAGNLAPRRKNTKKLVDFSPSLFLLQETNQHGCIYFTHMFDICSRQPAFSCI